MHKEKKSTTKSDYNEIRKKNNIYKSQKILVNNQYEIWRRWKRQTKFKFNYLVQDIDQKIFNIMY